MFLILNSQLTVDHRSAPDQQSTVLIVNWFTVDCWPSLLTVHHQSTPGQQSTVLIVNQFTRGGISSQWSTVDWARSTVNCWSGVDWQSTVNGQLLIRGGSTVNSQLDQGWIDKSTVNCWSGVDRWSTLSSIVSLLTHRSVLWVYHDTLWVILCPVTLNFR